MRFTPAVGVAAAALLQGVDAFWRLPCGVIQTSRLDPIINPGTISGHVHKIVGPPSINPNSNYDSLTNSRCTSCAVQADKSAYWTPLMYYQHKNGSFEEVPAGGTTVYYLGRGENASNIIPFPKGFQMISGNPAVRAYDNSTYTFGGPNGVIYTGGHCRTGDDTCVGGKFAPRTGKNDPSGPVFTGRPVSDRVSYACLDTQSMPETNSITRTQCVNGLRAQVHFPSCWNGKDPYLPGNKHVDYLSQIDNGICSPDFPIPLPLLFFEVLYSVSSIKQDGGQFVFSMGDPTGYGFHGDFLNGWDEDVLEQAIDKCLLDNPSGEISDCSTFSPYIDNNAGHNCPEQPEYYDEDVRGMIGTSLPGCNKVTPGPAPATSADLSCPPGTKVPPHNSTSNFNNETAPTNPAVGAVANGFAFAGCFNDDSGHSFSVVDTSSDDMTNAKCQAFCSGKGLPLAATEYSDECYCGYSLSSSTNTRTSCSTMICAGNSSEYCGGPSLLSVYNSTTYKGSYNPTLPSPGQDAGGGFTYMGCASEASSGRALSQASTTSSNMTNDFCASFCAGKGFSLFGTEFGSECYCGSSLAAGSSLGQSGCSMLCSGSPPTSGPFAQWANTCGGSRRLTVWRNNNLGGASAGSSASAPATASSKPAQSSSQPATIVTQKTTGSSVQSTFATVKTTAQSSGASVATAFPSPSSNVGNGFVYLGCISEPNSGDRALNVTRISGSNMTNEVCAAYCASQKLPLFGSEYGKECYCGNKLASGASAAQSGCSATCAGPQPTSSPFASLPNTCGGSSRLTLWNNTRIAAVSNRATVAAGGKTYKYKGCYDDSDVQDRAFEAASYSSDSMTVDSCVAFCQGKGYVLAGVEYGRECYCAAKLPAGLDKADEWDCDMQCDGDLSRWCGGSNRMNVYSA